MNASGHRHIWLGIFFLSGASGLGFEVLWFRVLSIVFGSTAHATAIVFATFFLGFAAGSYYLARFFATERDAGRSYARLEICAGFITAGFFMLFAALTPCLAALFTIAGESAFRLFLMRFFVGFVFLAVPAFFLGGTFPAMVRLLVRDRQECAHAGTLVYAVHTLGAVAGVFAVGFYLPFLLGFRISALVLALIHILCGISALMLRRRFGGDLDGHRAASRDVGRKSGATAVQNALTRRTVILATASGCIFVASEVLWVRMFSLVTPDDVYSFSIVLMAILVGIAAGATLARYFSSRARDGSVMLRMSLLGSAVMLALSPLFFVLVRVVFFAGGATASWIGSIGVLLFSACIAIVPAAAVMGILFPSLLKDAGAAYSDVGVATGELLFFNTVGAIVGSFLAGFFLIQYVGIFGSVALLSIVYSVLALTFFSQGRPAWRSAGVLLAASVIAFFTARIPEVSLRAEDGEVLKRVYRGRDGVVAVVSSRPPHYPPNFRDLFIQLNGYYILGGRGAAPHEARQAHLPLFLHPNPRSVFFLGLGTGITAGAALAHPIERMVIAEINPEVVRAAREYFFEENNNLFGDPRAHIVVEDARQYLVRTRDSYDVVVGDLFDAQASGVGNLYTKEHFELVRSRLTPGGLFAQWLPLHQLSREEFGSIARTFLEVFPQATLWRGNFDPAQPIAALVGEGSARPLEPTVLLRVAETFGGAPGGVDRLTDFLVSVRGLSALVASDEVRRPQFRDSILPHLALRTPFTFYAGNIRANASQFLSYPLETDDHPRIEYLAPKHRAITAGLVQSDTRDVLRRLFVEVPPSDDPYLSRLSEMQLSAVYAGQRYAQFVAEDFDARVSGVPGAADRAEQEFKQYLRLMALDRVPR